MIAGAIALVLVQALAVQAGIFSSDTVEVGPGNDIEALCKNAPIDLTKLSELRELSELAPHNPRCSTTMERALAELAKLIETGSRDLCAVDSIEAMHDFYLRYLDTSGRTDFVDKELLPRSLKNLALADGMQMSNRCKRNMVRVLTQEQGDLLSEEDYSLIDVFADEDGPIAKMLGDLTGPGELFMPSDLAPFLRSSGLRTKSMGSEKVFIQTSTSSIVRQLQAVCKRRFEPIYGPLLMPLARLANSGFNFKDSALKDDLKSGEVVSQVGRWSRLVFLCEALKGIQLVEERRDREAGEGTGERLVRIVTEEEARAIEGRASPLEPSGDESDDEFVQVDKPVYRPRAPVTLGNLIYDKENARLRKAISKFKTSRSERDIIRRRLFGKGFSMIKRELKQGHVGLIVSAGYKGILQRVKGTKVPETREQLVRTLDELVRGNEEGSDGPVAFKLDQSKLDKLFKLKSLKLGEAKTFVISVALVAIVVAAMVTFIIVSYAWIG